MSKFIVSNIAGFVLTQIFDSVDSAIEFYKPILDKDPFKFEYKVFRIGRKYINFVGILRNDGFISAKDYFKRERSVGFLKPIIRKTLPEDLL